MTLHPNIKERIAEIAAKHYHAFLVNGRYSLDFPTVEIAITAALTDLASEQQQWRDISSAPKDGTEVRLLLASGNTLNASMQSGFVDSMGRDCMCWVCSEEDHCPESWSDGACWENNENNEQSDQPTHWQPLPNPPTP
jgi:hypothetical protein